MFNRLKPNLALLISRRKFIAWQALVLSETHDFSRAEGQNTDEIIDASSHWRVIMIISHISL